MKKLIKNKKGFTLIELIVVIAILAILAAILIPSITGYINSATEQKNSANARSWYTETQLAAATATTAPTSPEDHGCTFTLTGKEVATFSCTIDSKVYSLANNFTATAP